MTVIDPTSAAPIQKSDHSYVDWPAIFAGTAVATAISLVLLTFGSAIGLSLASVREGSALSLAGFGIAAGLWILWVQISSFFAGGYLTGRMRRRNYDATEHESNIRDSAHGVTVWAVGMLIGAAIAVSGITAGVSATTTAATTVAAGAATGAAGGIAAASDDSAPSIFVDRLLRSDNAPQGGAQSDPTAEVGRVLVTSVANGAIDDADKTYLIRTVAARTGLSEQEATQRVDQFWSQVQAAEETAKATAEKARKVGVVSAFLIAASFLISAAAAAAGGVLGGNHRDKQVVFEEWSRWS